MEEQEHDQETGMIRSTHARKPDTSWFHDTLYAPGGFDLMTVLVRVASRPNPQIDLGPIDCGAAIIVCDTLQTDHPIVYCSEAFVALTGYRESEILGRNCRFLQSPPSGVNGEDALPSPAPPRDDPFDVLGVDQRRARQRLKDSLQRCEEVQVVIGNYTRAGTPFANLVSVVPVRWNSDDKEKRHMVGFQMCPTGRRRSSDGA